MKAPGIEHEYNQILILKEVMFLLEMKIMCKYINLYYQTLITDVRKNEIGARE